QQDQDLFGSGANRRHVSSPAGEMGRRRAPAHGRIHAWTPVAGGDTQRAQRVADRLKQLDAQLAHALDYRGRRHLVKPPGARRVRLEHLGKGEMGRELDILDGAESLAVLAHLPPPARGAEHHPTVHHSPPSTCQDTYTSPRKSIGRRPRGEPRSLRYSDASIHLRAVSWMICHAYQKDRA